MNPTMASSIVDSEAVFRSRAQQIGLKDEVIDAMAAKGWSSFATFSFSSTYVPGSQDDAVFLSKVVAPLLGSEDHRDGPKLSLLRRLVYESYTIMASEMRSRADRSGEEQPKKLPLAERAARQKKLAERLTGLPLDEAWEPSHHLIDVVSSMVEDGSVKYIAWSECVSREEEIRGQKKTKEWKPGADGILREVQNKEPAEKADTTSDLKLWQALHRRGVAMDVGGLMSYETHNLLVKMLVKELQKVPPTGFMAVSHEQLQRADVECWRIIASETTSGLSPSSSGQLPAELAMQHAVEAPSVRLLLLPLQGNNRRTSSNTRDDGPPPKRARQQPEPKPAAQTRRSVALPSNLEGSSRTPDGSSICFAFNLGNCKFNGKGCARGKHVCTRCFGDHPFSKCKQ